MCNVAGTNESRTLGPLRVGGYSRSKRLEYTRSDQQCRGSLAWQRHLPAMEASRKGYPGSNPGRGVCSRETTDDTTSRERLRATERYSGYSDAKPAEKGTEESDCSPEDERSWNGDHEQYDPCGDDGGGNSHRASFGARPLVPDAQSRSPPLWGTGLVGDRGEAHYSRLRGSGLSTSPGYWAITIFCGNSSKTSRQMLRQVIPSFRR